MAIDRADPRDRRHLRGDRSWRSPRSASSPARHAASASRWPCIEAFSASARRELTQELDPPFNERVLDAAARPLRRPRPPAHPGRPHASGSSTGSTSPATRRAGPSTASSSLKVVGFAVGLVAQHRCSPCCSAWSLLRPSWSRVGAGAARLLRAEPLPLPDGLRPRGADAADAARRARPADHLGRGRPRLRRRALAGRQQHRRPAGRGVRPRAAGDADRHGPHRRAARPRRAHPRPGAPQPSSPRWCRPTRSASRSARCCACSPTRCGSSVGSAPRRRRRRCRSRSCPADLLHPAVPVHRGHRPGGDQHDGRRSWKRPEGAPADPHASRLRSSPASSGWLAVAVRVFGSRAIPVSVAAATQTSRSCRAAGCIVLDGVDDADGSSPRSRMSCGRRSTEAPSASLAHRRRRAARVGSALLALPGRAAAARRPVRGFRGVRVAWSAQVAAASSCWPAARRLRRPSRRDARRWRPGC